jgi:hypothetical protein
MTDEEIANGLYEVDLADVYYYPHGNTGYNKPIKHNESKLVINKVTREIVSERTVSRQYKPIQFNNAYEYTKHQLTESGIEFKPVRIDNNGAYQNLLIALPANDIEVKVGDIVSSYFMLGTAHNGLKNYSLAHFTKRLWCLNGATTNKKEMELSIMHKGDTNRRIQDGLQLYLEGCIATVKELYEWLGNSRCNRQRLEAYLEAQTILPSEYYREELRAQINDNTMFDVYQAFTNLITHRYGRSVTSKLNKFNELNKECQKWEKIFGNTIEIIPINGYNQGGYIEETTYYAG